jgi:signal transduction histidine kinase
MTMDAMSPENPRPEGHAAVPHLGTANTTRPATIRGQLIWAALFPLAFFGLLSTLVIAFTLRQLTLNLALQRDTALAQALAGRLALTVRSGDLPDTALLAGSLQSLGLPGGSRVYVVDHTGNILSHSGPGVFSSDVHLDAGVWALIQTGRAQSTLLDSAFLNDQAIVSFAPLPGSAWGLVCEQSWAATLAPAMWYQGVLISLLALGTVLSAGMLSMSIGRIVRPIASLASQAGLVVPGSIFRPLLEEGPVELRTLTQAFNQMVIRLAEQQSAVRQYAQKALLSQEEERQRLSHELHDGTVQDLVGLVQRLELCANELDRDPALGRRRLSELETLARQTLDDVRRISNALRPSILQDLGLSAAVQALCIDLEQQMNGLRCECQITGGERRLPPDLELAVFRVVQEALSNVRRHASRATRARVALAFGEADLAATIEDSGPGLVNPDLRALVRSGHLGLAGMYERARLFGGQLDICSTPGEGTQITLRQPYPKEPRMDELGSGF